MYKLFLLGILVLSFMIPYVVAEDHILIESQKSPHAAVSVALLPIILIGGTAAAVAAGGVYFKLRSKFNSMADYGQEDMAGPFSLKPADDLEEMGDEDDSEPPVLEMITSERKDSRKINIWIRNHDSKKPLSLDWHELSFNVGKEMANTISTTSAEALEKILEIEDYPEIKILLVSDSFEIPEKSKKFLLPPQGNSDALSFKIKPIKLGNQSIEIFFYYKLNLLQVLSITLNIQAMPEISSNTSDDSSFLGTEILASSMNGLYSISEIIEDEK